MNVREINSDTEIECSCGRSPTGICVGWHSLNNEDFKVELKNWVSTNFLNGNLMTKENNDLVSES
jgi:hypothetical protein